MKYLCQVAGVLLLCLFCLTSCANHDESGSPRLEIRFLDVGQGDCALLRTSEGDILIDAGTEESQELLCLRLAQLGVEELLLAVFSHNDEDHIGGADGVLSQIPTREIWVADDTADNESAEFLFRAARAREIDVRVVRAGEIRHVGEMVLSILHPFPFAEAEGNDGSLVLKVHFGEIDLLFAGDVGSDGEEKIVERYGKSQLDCDLLKVAHHGSNTSSSDRFLATLTPQYAIIGVGAGNSYGHPMGEVLARLEKHGITTLRTDLEGEIVFVSDGSGLKRAK
ncbi:MAG: MBL fold metallo-hydrolase [Clostridia bacterium]|nr:MBL fold metallo-hydrolase [Clostridia bacterium]